MNLYELWRYVAVFNLAIVFGVSVFLNLRHGRDAPRVLRLAALGGGALLALVAIGVVANLLISTPPTLGLKVFAVGGTVIAIFFVVVAWRGERHPERYIAR